MRAYINMRVLDKTKLQFLQTHNTNATVMRRTSTMSPSFAWRMSGSPSIMITRINVSSAVLTVASTSSGAGSSGTASVFVAVVVVCGVTGRLSAAAEVALVHDAAGPGHGSDGNGISWTSAGIAVALSNVMLCTAAVLPSVWPFAGLLNLNGLLLSSTGVVAPDDDELPAAGDVRRFRCLIFNWNVVRNEVKIKVHTYMILLCR